MAFDPDDKRPLFERVVDDIRDQIITGKLEPEAKVPPARELAEQYGIASMTAQRALRELQSQGLIYGMPGKGSFVRPDARSNLRPDEVKISNDDEYEAVRAELHASLNAVTVLLDEAIASGDIEQIKAARDESARNFNENYGRMLGVTLYGHRKAGRDVDGPMPPATERKTARRTKPDTTAD